jgi:hypothetical protein
MFGRDLYYEPSHFTTAAVCKRGHVATRDVTSHAASERCSRCGAMIMSTCASCGQRIRGVLITPGVVNLGQTYTPPQFCDQCGTPHPWAGRQARIYELQNKLDEEELDSGTELVVREQLEGLLDPDLDEEEQAKRWKRIKSSAPGFLEKAATQPIVTSLLTAWLKKEVGLSPN